MDAARLKFVIEQCLRNGRKEDRRVFHAEVARFLGVQPITLRRWLSGERPVPRMAEVIFEILLNWPEIRAGAVDNVIAKRDKDLEVEKQH
jgi:hypothetical protein